MVSDSTALDSARDLKNYCEAHRNCTRCIFREKTEEIYGVVSGCPLVNDRPYEWDFWSNEVYWDEEDRDDNH